MQMLPEIRVTEFSIKAAEEVCEKLKEIQMSFSPEQPILVTISSPGGDMTALTMIYTALQSMPNQIITYTDSEACSAGAFLLAIGDVRVAAPDSFIMIHKAHSGAMGTSEALADVSKILKYRNDSWFAKVEERSRIKSLAELIKKESEGDFYMSPSRAKELNLVDYVGLVTNQMFQGVHFDIVTEESLNREDDVPMQLKKEKTKGKKRGK